MINGHLTVEDLERMQKNFLTLSEAANFLHMSTGKARGYLETGELDVAHLPENLGDEQNRNAKVFVSREGLIDWYRCRQNVTPLDDPRINKISILLDQSIQLQSAILEEIQRLRGIA